MYGLLLTSGPLRYEAVFDSCGTIPVGRQVPTCDSAHSLRLYKSASLNHQAAGTMTCYPTQSHYLHIEPNQSSPYHNTNFLRGKII